MKKIALCLISLIHFLPNRSSAQTSFSPIKKESPLAKRNFTLGFKTGGVAHFRSPVLYKSKAFYNTSSAVFVSKKITDHLSIETGINYVPGFKLAANAVTLPNTFQTKTCTISIPATAQYYLLKNPRKIKPYFGAGAMYNLSLSGKAPANTDASSPCCLQSGKKYISMLVTQGVIFEINTKIQLSESIHFVPNNNNRQLGIDIGFGYKL